MSTRPTFTSIPATDMWAVITPLEDESEPELCPVVGWVINAADPVTAEPLILPPGTLYPRTAESIQGDLKDTVEFVGPRERAERELRNAVHAQSDRRDWREHGARTIARITAWARDQAEPWSGMEAWESVRPPLDVHTHGVRVMQHLMGRGFIEQTDDSMFRTLADPEVRA